MASETTLKPCPFCGQQPILEHRRFGFEKFDRSGIFCKSCGIAIGWHEDDGETIRKWNHRADDAPPGHGCNGDYCDL